MRGLCAICPHAVVLRTEPRDRGFAGSEPAGSSASPECQCRIRRMSRDGSMTAIGRNREQRAGQTAALGEVDELNGRFVATRSARATHERQTHCRIATQVPTWHSAPALAWLQAMLGGDIGNAAGGTEASPRRTIAATPSSGSPAEQHRAESRVAGTAGSALVPAGRRAVRCAGGLCRVFARGLSQEPVWYAAAVRTEACSQHGVQCLGRAVLWCRPGWSPRIAAALTARSVHSARSCWWQCALSATQWRLNPVAAVPLPIPPRFRR